MRWQCSRSILAIVFGTVGCFTVTVLLEFASFSLMEKGYHLPFAEMVSLPLIAVLIGSLVGLIAEEKAQLGAALGLAPWLVSFVLGVARGRSWLSFGFVVFWIVVVLRWFLGVAAARFTSQRLLSRAQPSIRQ